MKAFGRCVELNPSCEEAVDRQMILKTKLANHNLGAYPPYDYLMKEVNLLHVDAGAQAVEHSEEIHLKELNLSSEDDDEWETDNDADDHDHDHDTTKL